MACLTTAQLVSVREEIGSESASGWTDQEILDRSEVLDSADPLVVALSIVKEKVADLLAAPAQWSLSGDYNENWSNNISRLEHKALDLEARIAAAAAGVTGAVIPGLPVITTESLGQLVPDEQYRIGDLD